MSLDLAELHSIAEQFGVSDEQVRRDHVVSHLLALISGELADRILFIGGTALARTHLPDGRLSEDLDLIALTRRSEVATALDRLLPRGASRAIGAPTSAGRGLRIMADGTKGAPPEICGCSGGDAVCPYTCGLRGLEDGHVGGSTGTT